MNEYVVQAPQGYDCSRLKHTQDLLLCAQPIFHTLIYFNWLCVRVIPINLDLIRAHTLDLLHMLCVKWLKTWDADTQPSTLHFTNASPFIISPDFDTHFCTAIALTFTSLFLAHFYMITNDRCRWICAFNEFLCIYQSKFKAKHKNRNIVGGRKKNIYYQKIVLTRIGNSCVAKVNVCIVRSWTYRDIHYAIYVWKSIRSFAMSSILRHFPYIYTSTQTHSHSFTDLWNTKNHSVFIAPFLSAPIISFLFSFIHAMYATLFGFMTLKWSLLLSTWILLSIWLLALLLLCF